MFIEDRLSAISADKTVLYKQMWESLKSAKCGNKELEVSLKALMEDIEEKYDMCSKI